MATYTVIILKRILFNRHRIFFADKYIGIDFSEFLRVLFSIEYFIWFLKIQLKPEFII